MTESSNETVEVHLLSKFPRQFSTGHRIVLILIVTREFDFKYSPKWISNSDRLVRGSLNVDVNY